MPGTPYDAVAKAHPRAPGPRGQRRVGRLSKKTRATRALEGPGPTKVVSRLRVSWAEAHAQARWMGRLYPENENDSQIVEKGHGTERASVFKERVSEPSKNCTQLTSIHILSSIQVLIGNRYIVMEL